MSHEQSSADGGERKSKAQKAAELRKQSQEEMEKTAQELVAAQERQKAARNESATADQAAAEAEKKYNRANGNYLASLKEQV